MGEGDWEEAVGALGKRIDELDERVVEKLDKLAQKTDRLVQRADLAVTKATSAVNNSLEAFQQIGRIAGGAAKSQEQAERALVAIGGLRTDVETLSREMRQGFADLRGTVREHAQSLTDLQELQDAEEDTTLIRNTKAVARAAVEDKVRQASELEQKVAKLEEAAKKAEDDKKAAELVKATELKEQKENAKAWKWRAVGAILAAVTTLGTSLVLHYVFHIG